MGWNFGRTAGEQLLLYIIRLLRLVRFYTDFYMCSETTLPRCDENSEAHALHKLSVYLIRVRSCRNRDEQNTAVLCVCSDDQKFSLQPE